jgi:hypothetical protein
VRLAFGDVTLQPARAKSGQRVTQVDRRLGRGWARPTMTGSRRQDGLAEQAMDWSTIVGHGLGSAWLSAEAKLGLRAAAHIMLTWTSARIRRCVE